MNRPWSEERIQSILSSNPLFQALLNLTCEIKRPGYENEVVFCGPSSGCVQRFTRSLNLPDGDFTVFLYESFEIVRPGCPGIIGSGNNHLICKGDNLPHHPRDILIA